MNLIEMLANHETLIGVVTGLVVVVAVLVFWVRELVQGQKRGRGKQPLRAAGPISEPPVRPNAESRGDMS